MDLNRGCIYAICVPHAIGCHFMPINRPFAYLLHIQDFVLRYIDLNWRQFEIPAPQTNIQCRCGTSSDCCYPR